MLYWIKVSLICYMQNQVIKNIALNDWIVDMIISFYSSGTALASDSVKVGCRSVFFFPVSCNWFSWFFIWGLSALHRFLFISFVKQTQLTCWIYWAPWQMVCKPIIHIIWCFFNWWQHSQIMVVLIRGTLSITVVFSVNKEVNSIIQWKAIK